LQVLRNLQVPLNGWLADKIAAQAESVSPENFVDLFLPKHELEESGAWVAWLISVHSDQKVQRRRKNELQYFLLRPDATAKLHPAPADVIPEAWRAWIMAALFEIDPTKDTLAAALEAISIAHPAKLWQQLEYRSSWPLAACLAAADSPANLLSFAKLLRNNMLGDIQDWRAAEKHWGKKVDLNLLVDSVNDEKPWDVLLLMRAPPVICIPPWLYAPLASKTRSGLASAALLQKANQAFERSNSKVVKTRLAELCLLLMRNAAAKSLKDNLNAVAWIDAASGSASYLIPRPKRMVHAHWIALLDACKLQYDYSWNLHYGDNFEAMEEGAAHPALLRTTILSIEAYGSHDFGTSLIAANQLESAKRAIANYTAPTPESRADLAILRFYVGTVSPSEDDALFDDISKIADTEPRLWSALLSALKTAKISQQRINALIVKTYLTIGPDHMHASTALRMLRDALQKNTSDLANLTTWDRLALPLPYPAQPLLPRLAGGFPAKPVRIDSIEFRDIRSLHRLSMKFSTPAEDRGQWVVIIGPNGVGKTTILQSITLALRSLKHPAIWPNGAFAKPWQRVVHANEVVGAESSISITLGDGVEHKTLVRSGSIGIAQSPEQDSPHLFPIFAYGCRRGSALGGAAQKVNLNQDGGPEIATLFDEGADLIQAETWLIGLEGDISKNPRSKVIYDAVVEALSELLDLTSVEVMDQQVWVTERDHPRLPFKSLSDGYLTNAGWFLDLVARWIELTKTSNESIQTGFLSRMRGLVLIDEIDLHLHPKWQIEIIDRTRRLLPAMSFIVTTHNPLTLVGAKAEEIWVLSTDDGRVKATCGVETPMLLTGGQIYRRYFGIEDIYPNGLGRALQRYSFLSGYALRNDVEQEEMEALQTQLKDAGLDPGWNVVVRTTVQDEPLEVTKQKRAPSPRKAGAA
jgi:energy-coupling factor transporter ATP-binding protein EcfA2